jgi:hypothetical protein
MERESALSRFEHGRAHAPAGMLAGLKSEQIDRLSRAKIGVVTTEPRIAAPQRRMC